MEEDFIVFIAFYYIYSQLSSVKMLKIILHEANPATQRYMSWTWENEPPNYI